MVRAVSDSEILIRYNVNTKKSSFVFRSDGVYRVTTP